MEEAGKYAEDSWHASIHWCIHPIGHELSDSFEFGMQVEDVVLQHKANMVWSRDVSAYVHDVWAHV